MAGWVGSLRRALVSGTAASATSTAAPALLAQAEGRGALQPVNSTSHWLNGKRAASFREADLTNTAVGYATHQTATMFWALLFEHWVGARRPVAKSAMIGKALAVSAIAAVVDYTITPERFTPGWELVLSKRSMAFGYLAMAIGLAAATAATNRRTTVSAP